MNKEFFINNRKALAEKIKDDSMVVFFSGKAPREGADMFYPFSVERNFFYLTGIDREDIVLTISKAQGKVVEVLYIPPVNELFERWNGELLKKDEAKEISGIETIIDRDEFEKNFGNNVISRGRIDNIYLLSYLHNLNEPLNESQKLASLIRQHYPGINIINSMQIMIDLRSIKQPEEIEEIKKAIDITKEGLEYLMSNLKPGIFEYEARAHYEYIVSLKGSKKGFDTIAATGANATCLHYTNLKDQSKDGQMMLFDLGALSNYYSSDISRTYPVNGKYTAKQKELYNIVLDAQQIVFDFMEPGVTEMQVNKKVKDFYAKSLKSIKLIKDDAEVSKYYMHGTGHPLGLDVHDFRRKDKVIVENSVYTVEPGLYIDDIGIGIRIEDDVLVTKDGIINLSKYIIKTTSDIENFMK